MSDVKVFKSILNPDQVRSILAKCDFKPSAVIGPTENKVQPKSRISDTWWYQNEALCRQLIGRVGLDTSKYFEKIQVVRYKPGGFFKPHHDSVASPSTDRNWNFKNHGHREYTLLIWLSDPTDYEGGETHFPSINQSYKLNSGDAILFPNVRDGKLINLHGANPVMKGEKKVCNLWIHERA